MDRSVGRTELFYLWEKRLRGWDVYDHPIDPELNFYPYLQKYVHQYDSPNTEDDGRHGTWLSGIGDFFQGRNRESEVVVPKTQEPPELKLPVPKPFFGAEETVEFHLLLPQEYRTKHSLMQQILVSMAFCALPVKF